MLLPVHQSLSSQQMSLMAERVRVGNCGDFLKDSVMRLITKSFSQDDWTGIISEFQDLSLMQTWEYGEAKARTGPWEVERTCF